MRSRISGGAFFTLQRGVDARHQALAGGLFVAAGAVDLSAEKEARDLLGLERAFEFGGIDGVVFDGVARPQHVGIFEAGDRLQNLQLDFDRQGGAHAVDVNLVGVQTLGLEEELVRDLVGELDDLVFDRRAVARTDGMDLPAVHGRAMNVFADDALSLRRSPGDVAGHLRIVMSDAAGAETEGRGIGIAGLHFEAGPVDGAAVEARRSAGLEAAAAQAELLERLRRAGRRRVRRSVRRDIAVRRSGSGR